MRKNSVAGKALRCMNLNTCILMRRHRETPAGVMVSRPTKNDVSIMSNCNRFAFSSGAQRDVGLLHEAVANGQGVEIVGQIGRVSRFCGLDARNLRSVATLSSTMR